MRVVLCILFVLSLVPPLPAAEPRVADGIVAIVNDSIITMQQLYRISASDLDVVNRTYFNQEQKLTEKRQALLNDAMQQLVDRQLILEDFKKSGLNLPESFIDEEVKTQIRRVYGDRPTFTKSLRAQGKTIEEFRQEARDEIIIAAMEQKNIRSVIQISPKKIETYYATNLAKYKVEDQVRLRVIVFPSTGANHFGNPLQGALDVRQKILEGAPFGDMATIYSGGSAQRDRGNWGWQEKKQLNPGLGAIAFSLPVGVPSRVIGLAREANDDFWIITYDDAGKPVAAHKYSGKDTFIEEKTGAALNAPEALPPPVEYYLMMVEEKQVAHTKALEEVRDEIEKELILRERAALRKQWLDRLRLKSFVRYF